jgi:hypothetical protein
MMGVWMFSYPLFRTLPRNFECCACTRVPESKDRKVDGRAPFKNKRLFVKDMWMKPDES